LKLCNLFGGDADSNAQNSLVKNRKTVKRGEFLYRTGDQFRAVYAIRSGLVKTSLITNDGRVQVTGFHGSGKVLGLNAILTSCYNCEATAMESTMVCEIPYSRIEELSKTNTDLQFAMMQIMSQEILEIRELMVLLGKMNGSERVACYLLNICKNIERHDTPSVQFKLSMSRSDIGNYLGMAEETISRIFTRFQDDGLITLQRRNVTINDYDRLVAVAYRK
jgi:CRP/FNR family transcriptional regulator